MLSHTSSTFCGSVFRRLRRKRAKKATARPTKEDLKRRDLKRQQQRRHKADREDETLFFHENSSKTYAVPSQAALKRASRKARRRERRRWNLAHRRHKWHELHHETSLAWRIDIATGRKLDVFDSVYEMWHAATVIETDGDSIQLRLDGQDWKSDTWIDDKWTSTDIAPLCTRSTRTLYDALSNGCIRVALKMLQCEDIDLIDDGLHPALRWADWPAVRTCLWLGVTRDDVQECFGSALESNELFSRSVVEAFGVSHSEPVLCDAVANRCSESFVGFLADAGADPNAVMSDGRNFLQYVVQTSSHYWDRRTNLYCWSFVREHFWRVTDWEATDDSEMTVLDHLTRRKLDGKYRKLVLNYKRRMRAEMLSCGVDYRLLPELVDIVLDLAFSLRKKAVD